MAVTQPPRAMPPAGEDALRENALALPDMDDGLAIGEQASPYTVQLPGFNGPLDLLLHLIERNQLEITTISLVAVTDQFVAYLRMWDEPPLPRLAEFVAMAARLLLIKSRSLLPRQPRQAENADENDPLDDAEQLRQHLIEYKLAREIARALRARELAGLHSFTRAQRLVDPEAMLTMAPPKLVGLNVNALALVFRRALLAQRFSTPEELPLPLVTVADKMAEIEAMLQQRARVTLEEALLTAETRFAAVVTFLAVLEMWHQARLVIEQEELFSTVIILPGPEFMRRIGSAGYAITAVSSNESTNPEQLTFPVIPTDNTGDETAHTSEFDPVHMQSPQKKARRTRKPAGGKHAGA